MKACPRCKTEKSDEEFHRRTRGGLASYCKPCYQALGAERYKANPERTKTQSSAWAKANRARINELRQLRRADPVYRESERVLDRIRDRERYPDRWIRDYYKLTREQWDQMLADQGGGCAICGTTEPRGAGTFHVDHDHNCCPGKKSCGKCVRGLLCNGCNPMLGYVNDDPAILRRAIEYLEKAR